MALLVEGPRGGTYQRESVNLWFARSGDEWELSMEFPNQDLAILLAYKLHKNWNAELRLVARTGADDQDRARTFLENLLEVARLPGARVIVAKGGDPEEPGAVVGGGVPRADFNILPLPEDPDFESLVETARRLGSPCLFTRDSGRESALA